MAGQLFTQRLQSAMFDLPRGNLYHWNSGGEPMRHP